MPYLHELDPISGAVIRTSKATAVRYQRDRPGELVHVDVKKIGKIPEGGGWRLHGRGSGQGRRRGVKVGYDYVHSMVDDCTRLAYSEVHDDETALTCAGFLRRAAVYFAGHGITVIEREASLRLVDGGGVTTWTLNFLEPILPEGNGE